MIETQLTYRPKEIFGLSNSFEYQRIYGEIHVDDKIEVDLQKNKVLGRKQSMVLKLTKRSNNL